MRRMALLLTLTMLIVLLAACGGKSGSGNNGGASATNSSVKTAGNTATAADSGKTGEVVTIRTSISDGELSKDQIAEFEAKYPNIKIEIEQLDGTKLAAELATNSAPDVIRISGAFETSSYAIRGIAMDLTDRIEGSSVIKMEDLVPMASVFRFDGKKIGAGAIYGLPKDWSNDFAIWYNKKAFDAAGVPLPDSKQPLTWPEVMELAKKLTKKDGNKIKQYGLAASEWGKTEPNFNLLLQYVLSAGGKINAADNATMDFNVQPVKDFINMWVEAVKSNVGPNSLNNDQVSGGDLFLSDKAAMLIDGYWYSGVIRSNENTKTHLADFGMLPTPIAPNGTRMAPTGGATGAIINKNTKHPDEAWKFYEWFFGGKPADDRAKTGWGLPAFQSKMALLPQETDFDKQVYGVLQDELKYAGFLPVNPYLSGGGWGIFDKYVQPLYFGKSSVDQAIAGITKDANVAITEAKNAAGQ
ncbi:MAG: transporter substrate-binding protein [Cohnella sp.]|nr:transporter substrate-binding protein [Cohnella sp.]